MIYDIVIIGGGPAGLMAAARSGERGARVLVLEKNSQAGIKFLMTGHGRCNLTNTSADNKQTIGAYGPNGKFLFSAFNKFGVSETLDFFVDLGIKTKVEDWGRVFPESNHAKDILSALVKYLKKLKVEIRFGADIKKIVADDGRIVKLVLAGNEEILGKNFVIATGGKSYPQTGSTGDGYGWLTKLGHTVNTPRPALTPIIVKDKIVKQLEGASFKDVGLAVWQNNKKIFTSSGEMIFTADGVSGPAIIDLSGRLGAFLSKPLLFQIDFQPGFSLSDFEKKLQNDWHANGNKQFKNYLAGFVPPKLAPVILKLSGIRPDKTVNGINKNERLNLARALKEFTLEVKDLKGFDKAMLTAGGVEVKEINPKTMCSRLYSNLFVVGEILDIDGPTGGYNLQLCWSTGYTAGDSAEF